jgi:hypothetical protein
MDGSLEERRCSGIVVDWQHNPRPCQVRPTQPEPTKSQRTTHEVEVENA